MAKNQNEKLIVLDPSQIRTGMHIRIHQTITEMGAKGTKERIQVFEGLVLNIGGNGLGKTMTVRKISNGVGVEKIFPLTLPTIEKIELVRQFKARRKNMSFLRTEKKRLKEITPKIGSMPVKIKTSDDKVEAIPEQGETITVEQVGVVPEAPKEEVETKEQKETQVA